jgi:hypothetical protein
MTNTNLNVPRIYEFPQRECAAQLHCFGNLMTTTLSTLLDSFGPLLSYDQLAKILQRKPSGLRMSLCRPATGWERELNAAKVQIGRRVLFDTHRVANLIEGCLQTGGDPSWPADELQPPESDTGTAKRPNKDRVRTKFCRKRSSSVLERR